MLNTTDHKGNTNQNMKYRLTSVISIEFFLYPRTSYPFVCKLPSPRGKFNKASAHLGGALNLCTGIY